MSTTTETQSTDDFLASREDWYARGCPYDHPYAAQLCETLAAPRPSWVEPLVAFA